MDRGIKIAVFVASIVALSLGLIWDQVLKGARVMIEKTPENPLGPERMEASVGLPGTPRFEFPSPAHNPAPPAAARPAESPTQPPSANPADSVFTEYLVVEDDSWWRIAEKVWGKKNARDHKEIQDANPNVKQLRAGMRIRIPPHKQP